ncbi:hypothetical protein EI94DRAFT_1702944 [Lactarius quietus]|nr:hypothetical protein EI94DRAFT_1702944 [Lactarius quietus]
MATKSNLGFSANSASCHLPSHSHMLGSMLHSGFNPSVPSFLQKPPSFHDTPPAPDLPSEVLEALSDSQLSQNSKYCQLEHKYHEMCEILTTYMGRNLRESESCAMLSETPDIYQALTQAHHPWHQVIRPLNRGWTAILTGTLISSSNVWSCHPCTPTFFQHLYSEITMIVKMTHQRKLITTVNSNPCTAVHCSLPWTKTFLRKWFLAEYDQAILELEAQQTILRLYSAHWKADTLIRQMLLQRSETGSKDTPHNVASANSAPMAPTDIAPTAPAKTAPVAPANAAKHVFEHSPSSKSPSAQHVQKCSKDEAASTQWKTTSSLAAYNLQFPAVPKLVPSFLSHTKVICADATPINNFQPISIDPSGASTTHLQQMIFDSSQIHSRQYHCILTAILTSDFPLLKNAPHLIRSMNAQWSFKEGEPSLNVVTLLKHVQFTDPGIRDLDEDNMGKGWGHYQFTAGDLNLSSLLTCWQDVRSIATAFKLVAAAIKTYQEAQLMDANTTTPQAGRFISDIYLERTLDCLQNCWVDAGGVHICHLSLSFFA